MTPLLKIALRNLFRNKKRSLITLVAICFGLASLIFLRNFVYGAHFQMVENITSTLTTDAQIVPGDFKNLYDTGVVIEEPEQVRQVLRSDPRVIAFSERVVSSGIVSSPNRSLSTFILGYDFEGENRVRSNLPLRRGRYLTPADEAGAFMGDKMCASLGVDIGDKIVVTAQDYYGALTGGAYRLVGTFETGSDPVDYATVVLSKPIAQTLLSFDQRISKFALRVAPSADLKDVLRDLQAKLDRTGGEKMSVLSWDQLIPLFSQMIQFQNGMIFIIMLIVLVVVAAGILNTMMMSIIERVREFGLMMAIGTPPSQVIRLVVLESFLLSLAGAALGVAIGLSLTAYVAQDGIDLSRFTSAFSNFLIGSNVRPRVDWTYLFIFLGVILGSTLVVSLYPAWRASRLSPIDALRQVG